MSDTASRPNQSDLKADWVDYVRSLDPHGNQGDPESMTKDELTALADQLEEQGTGAETDSDTLDGGTPADANDETATAGTPEAGETRTAEATGSGDAGTDTGPWASTSDYDTQTAGPSSQPTDAGQPQRTSTQRSETTSAVTDRAPEEAERLAGEQTPAASERIMGLPDSPRAGETGQGH
jgi:hypothetical protein